MLKVYKKKKINKMKNISLTSLSLSSISKSPYFTLATAKSSFFFTIKNSLFNKFSNNLLRSHTSAAAITLKSSTASNFLESAIYVNTEAYKKGTYRLTKKDMTENINIGASADSVACQEMIFINCTTKYDGGAVFCVVGGHFYCNFSAFTNCYTAGNNKGGAVYCISNYSNFTGTCFVDCSSAIGSCVYSPEVSYLTSFELCQTNDIKPSTEKYQTPRNIFSLNARDILITGGNISKCILSTPLLLTPAQNLEYFNNHFMNVSSTNSSMFLLEKMNDHMNFNQSNIVDCDAESANIFTANGNSFKLMYAVIMNNKFGHLLGGSINKFTAMNCTFDFESTIAVDDSGVSFVDSNSSFLNKTATYFVFDQVSTKGCWAHSTYVWENAALWKQGIVLAFLLIAVIVAIAAVIIHKKKEFDAKSTKDSDEGLLDGFY